MTDTKDFRFSRLGIGELTNKETRHLGTAVLKQERTPRNSTLLDRDKTPAVQISLLNEPSVCLEISANHFPARPKGHALVEAALEHQGLYFTNATYTPMEYHMFGSQVLRRRNAAFLGELYKEVDRD